MADFEVTRVSTPSSQQGPKLVGQGAVGAAFQGCSVALSGEGNTALVGGYGDAGRLGAVWVFTRNGKTWTQQGGKLVPNGLNDAAQCGTAVAISADGNTAIVTGPNNDGDKGGAWVFSRTGSSWTQQGDNLRPASVTNSAFFGASVSISADGNTVIVGANNYFQQGAQLATGAAWIFVRVGSRWNQQGDALIGTGALGNSMNQGVSVALSADGNTAAIGATLDGANVGAVWVFTRQNGEWTQQGAKIVGSGAIGASGQGQRVSLSADGNTLAIGATNDDPSTAPAKPFAVGAVWVFSRSGAVWSQQSKLVASDAVGNALQGSSVSLSADGDTLLVGGMRDDQLIGATWVWRRNSGRWTPFGKLVGSPVVGIAGQGASAALSADGSMALVGGQRADNDEGGAWFFIAASAPTITGFTPVSGPVGTLVTITGTGFLGLVRVEIGGVAALAISNDGTTLVAMVMLGAATGVIKVTTAAGSVSS